MIFNGDERDRALAFLTREGGHLLVPCSRYGRTSAEVAPFAWAAAVCYSRATGELISDEQLDFIMGLAVNDHDDVQYLIEQEGDDEFMQLLRENGIEPLEQDRDCNECGATPMHDQIGSDWCAH